MRSRPAAIVALTAQLWCTSAAGQTLQPAGTPARPAVWSEYPITANDRAISTLVMRTADPKPVVFLLQGSGCTPLFTVDSDGVFHSTSLFHEVTTERFNRFHFAQIQKHGVPPLRFTAGMTREEQVRVFERAQRDCSPEYLRHATKDVRVDDVIAAVRAVSIEPWAKGIVLAGHSEGTHVVTGVLRRIESGRIAAAALFASAGPIPFYGGYAASGGGNREGFARAFEEVQMLQNAPDDLMYRGHPGRRWKTYWLNSNPIDDVRDSSVPLFVTHGTRDGSILAPDLFVLEALRQQPKRPLRYVVLEGGDHDFQTPDDKSRLTDLIQDFLSWVELPNKPTGITVWK